MNTNPCSFRDLFLIEYREARNCLGFDFLDDLKAAMADYSAAPAYVAGTTYNLDDVVSFEGIFYKVTVATTTALPTVKTDWTVAPKFDPAGACGAKYEEFYCNFLAPYLAYTVLSNRLPYMRNAVTDLGVIQYQGNRYDASNKDEYSSLQYAVDRDREIAWFNMEYELTENLKEDSCFENFKGFDDECKTGVCRPTRNRSGVYRFG